MVGGRENDPKSIVQAREMLNEIASAWSQIGAPRPA
jgi:hypothetical protein